jgi:type IV secretion system protein VirD4
VSTFQSLMRCFASDAVKASLADGLDPLAVADGSPLTVYLVMPPDKLHSHAALLRLWIASLMGHITQRRTRPERRTLFVIDEAAQLGPLPQLRTAVTLARGYGLRAIIVLQSPAQLRATFESDWEVFLENCGVVMTFGVDRPGMAQTMASWLGDIAPETLARLQSTQLAVRQGDAQTVVLGRIDMLKDRPFKDRLGANPMFATQGGRR